MMQYGILSIVPDSLLRSPTFDLSLDIKLDIGRGSFQSSLNVSMKEVGLGLSLTRGTEKEYVVGA